jgi:hypothetical protein
MERVNPDPIHCPRGVPPETEPTCSKDGVDLTLIRWMLSLSPGDRLKVLQERQTAIERARQADPRWTSELS